MDLQLCSQLLLRRIFTVLTGERVDGRWGTRRIRSFLKDNGFTTTPQSFILKDPLPEDFPLELEEEEHVQPQPQEQPQQQQPLLQQQQQQEQGADPNAHADPLQPQEQIPIAVISLDDRIRSLIPDESLKLSGSVLKLFESMRPFSRNLSVKEKAALLQRCPLVSGFPEIVKVDPLLYDKAMPHQKSFVNGHTSVLELMRHLFSNQLVLLEMLNDLAQQEAIDMAVANDFQEVQLDSVLLAEVISSELTSQSHRTIESAVLKPEIAKELRASRLAEEHSPDW